MSGGERARFERPAPEVARDLLGAVLGHRTPAGAVAIRLTEVEAYQGQGEDPGSHAHRGRTARNAALFGPPGHLYAYFTYGMHTCCNVVALPEGLAGGVLLRAGEVVEGRGLAIERRGEAVRPRDLARGPARLAVALGAVLADDGADLLTGVDWSLELDPVAASTVRTGPRVGVSGEGGTAAFPWRFWIEGDPTVSPYRAAKPRIRSG